MAAPELDFSKPTMARAYDTLLGGKDNFEADRTWLSMPARTSPGSKNQPSKTERSWSVE